MQEEKKNEKKKKRQANLTFVHLRGVVDNATWRICSIRALKSKAADQNIIYLFLFYFYLFVFPVASILCHCNRDNIGVDMQSKDCWTLLSTTHTLYKVPRQATQRFRLPYHVTVSQDASPGTMGTWALFVGVSASGSGIASPWCQALRDGGWSGRQNGNKTSPQGPVSLSPWGPFVAIND